MYSFLALALANWFFKNKHAEASAPRKDESFFQGKEEQTKAGKLWMLYHDIHFHASIFNIKNSFQEIDRAQ